MVANAATVQSIPCVTSVGPKIHSVVGEVVVDREEVVLCILLVALKVHHVHSELCPAHCCSEAVDPLQTQPVLPLRVTKASDIVLPSPVEVHFSVLAFLEDHPLSVVHVTPHLEWLDAGAARVNGVDPRRGAASLVHLPTVTRETRALWCACSGDSQSINVMKGLCERLFAFCSMLFVGNRITY